MRRPLDAVDQWRRRQAPALIRLGIPAAIVEVHRRFLLAVQNGEDPDSGFTSGWGNEACVADLLSLLSGVFADPGRDLVADLRRRASA